MISNWVTGGAPVELVEPALFLNVGHGKDVNADVTKCAVDTKEVRIVQIKAVCEALQRYPQC